MLLPSNAWQHLLPAKPSQLAAPAAAAAACLLRRWQTWQQHELLGLQELQQQAVLA
jgi:hypothetical protein